MSRGTASEEDEEEVDEENVGRFRKRRKRREGRRRSPLVPACMSFAECDTLLAFGRFQDIVLSKSGARRYKPHPLEKSKK